MQKTTISTLLVILMFSILHVYGQSEQLSKSTSSKLFTSLETPTYIIYDMGFSNLGPLLYEVNVSPLIKLEAKDYPQFGFLFFPQIILRMYNVYSRPVWTPSYMPREVLFYHLPENKSKNDKFIFVSLGHHSNGQDGDIYLSDSITMNTINGSFSTNYLSIGYEFFHKSEKQLNLLDGLRLSTTFHSIDDIRVRNSYGRWRLNADLKSTFLFNHESKNLFTGSKERPCLTGWLNLGWIALDMDQTKPFDLKRLIFKYTLSYQPAIINDLEIFVRYYYGQDYYNINYKRRLNALQFGISLKELLLR